MKSWRGVSLDPGSGGHWFENRALGWRMCSGGITHTPKDGGTQWEITALSLFVHLPATERAHCVPLGLILSHQPPQKPPDPITGIRPGPRPWDGEPRNRPESTAHSLKITHTHTRKIWGQEETPGRIWREEWRRKHGQKSDQWFQLLSFFLFFSKFSELQLCLLGMNDEMTKVKQKWEPKSYHMFHL